MSAKYPLSDALYMQFRNMLHQRAGLHYPEHRREDLAHGLNRAITETTYANLAELYQGALDHNDTWDLIISHLTVGETRFFRNEAQIAALRSNVLPGIIQQRSSLRSMRIWSAGCATGEEPYSLAMLISELPIDLSSWNVSILATDINLHFLNRAREALYGAWSFRETSEALRERFFQSEGTRWRLNPDIRRMVTFHRLNLVEATYPSLTNGTGALDLIVCRNVTIYFGFETTRQVIDRFYDALVPGGWLLVGHSEPQAATYHRFETHNFPNAIFYRKPLDAPLFPTMSARGRPGTGSLNPARLRPGTGSLNPPRPQPGTGGLTSAAPRPVVVGWPETPSRPSTGALGAEPAAPAPAAEPQDGPEQVWAAIQEQVAQGDKAGAEAQLRTFLERHPQHAAALTLLGQMYADRGDWDGAKQYCERALKAEPLQTSACYLLGQVYEHQQDLDEALATYRRTTYIDRQFVMGVLGMARVWRQMDRAEEARRAYRNALKILDGLPPDAVVECTEGATSVEVSLFVRQQAASLR